MASSRNVALALVLGISVLAAGIAATASAQVTPGDAIPQDVQTTVDTLFSGDRAAVQALLHFTQVPCQGDPANHPENPNPACPEGTADGTSVDAIPVAACEGAYQRADQLGDVLDTLAAKGPQLFGVYRAASQPIGLMSGEFTAVFTGFPGTSAPGAVWIKNDGISSVHLSCAEGPSNSNAFVTAYDLQGPLAKQGGAQLPTTGQGSREPWGWPRVAIWGLLGVALTMFALRGLLKPHR